MIPLYGLLLLIVSLTLSAPATRKKNIWSTREIYWHFIEFIIFQKCQSKHYFKQQTKRILVEPLQFDSMLPWRKKFCLKQNLFFGCNDSLSNSRPISVTCTYRNEDDVWCRHCLFFIISHKCYQTLEMRLCTIRILKNVRQECSHQTLFIVYYIDLFLLLNSTTNCFSLLDL